MFQFLNQPISLTIAWPAILKRYSLVGLFVAFFLIVFQPFGTANVQIPNKLLFLSGYGWITFISVTLIIGGLPRLLPRLFEEDKWVVWKQMVLLGIGLSFCFVCCYLYMNFWFGWRLSINSFLGFYAIALAIAVMPIIVITLVEYIFHLKSNQAVAHTLNEQIQPSVPTDTILQLKDENDRVDFTIPLDQLLFIKAANNYVEVNYLEEEDIKKYLLRNSIRNIEQQLPNPSIKRCHRSYIVNMAKVGRITGNAQGYKLHFPFTAEYVVPVSRSKGKELLELMNTP